MNVFWALMTMIGRSGRDLLDARQQVEGVLVGHHHVGDDEVALAAAPPSATASRHCRSSAPHSRRATAPGSAPCGSRHRRRPREMLPSGHGQIVPGSASRAPARPGSSTRKVVRRGVRLAFDDAAMVADDLGDQARGRGRTRSALVVTNGSNRIGHHVLRARRGPLSRDAELERQRHLARELPAPRADARPEGRGQHDLAIGRVADRLGRVLHQVQEDLHRAGRGWRKPAAARDRIRRRCGSSGRSPICARRRHVIEDDVDVDRLALDRPLVGEHLHAVDQLHDAVGLVADEPRQGAVLVVDR